MWWWPEPAPGDIVWCHFPDNINPKAKPRPALIVTVLQDEGGHFVARVAYGTSQKTTRLFSGEFCISKSQHPAAYASANLSFDTKFDFGNITELPFNSDWFAVPPAAPHGQTPKLGVLHPSMVRIAAAAFANA